MLWILHVHAYMLWYTHTYTHAHTYLSFTHSNTSSFGKIIFSYIVSLVVDIHPLLLLPPLVSNLFWNMFYSESINSDYVLIYTFNSTYMGLITDNMHGTSTECSKKNLSGALWCFEVIYQLQNSCLFLYLNTLVCVVEHI